MKVSGLGLRMQLVLQTAVGCGGGGVRGGAAVALTSSEAKISNILCFPMPLQIQLEVPAV